MADKKLIALAGIAGGAAALAWWLTQVPPQGKHRLSVKATADGREIALEVSVDGARLTTPGHADLDPGVHTITAPDEIIIEGAAYSFASGEEG